MRDYKLSEAGMRKLTELAEARGGKGSAADKVRIIESAVDRMYQQWKSEKEGREMSDAEPV